MTAPHAASPSRRDFLRTTAGIAAAGLLPATSFAETAAPEPAFRISLAEWSLHKTLRAKKITNLDFPVVTRQEFGLDAVEYVNSFFKDKAEDEAYLADLNKRCDGEGVRSLLIMVDGEGQIGTPDASKRAKAVENHHRWVSAAKTLGCHSIRVNASSAGTYEEQQKLAADGLSKLGEYADQFGIDVLVENHGGWSSHGAWLAGVMELVGRPNVGTLPDFGNFKVGKREGPGGKPVDEWYDRYTGVAELMPYAKAVSAKSHEFDASGNEVRSDYFRLMKIVLESGYSGYVGIEWEGGKPDEYEGIRLTKRLLERVRDGIA
ncbi:MAG: TIM barrel protein [Planctomycetota bacterium]